MKDKDFNGAVIDCGKAMQVDENNLNAYVIRATAYFALNQNMESIADFNTAIAIIKKKNFDSSDIKYRSYMAGAYVGLGENYQKMGKNEEAAINYKRAIEMRPDFVSTYSMKGRVETSLHHYENAVADYTRVIELSPDNAAAYASRAFDLDELHRTEDAITDNTKAVELNPRNDVAFNNLGYEKSRMGRYEEAEADLQKAIDLIPHHGFAFRGLGVIKYWQGDYDEAIAIFNKAIEYRGTVPEGYDFRGLAETKAGKYTEAMADFNKAIELKPANADAYLNMGELQIYEADYLDAIASLNKAIAIDTSLTRSYNSLGYAWFKLKSYTKAIAYFDSAKVKGGDLYRPYFQYRSECVAVLNRFNIDDFTHLEWIGPVEDANKMYRNTFISSKPGITVWVKVSSSKPINKNSIQLLINGKPEMAANGGVTIADTGVANQNKLTGEFEYEYKADVLLPKGESEVSVTYDNKTVQPLTVKQN